MEDDTNLIQVSTATDSAAAAQAIADHLVESRLAACVQVVGPVVSTYRWEGKVERAEEYLCLVKSRSELLSELEAAIRSLHSYDNPEIIAVPIVAGGAEYLRWVESETEPPDTSI